MKREPIISFIQVHLNLINVIDDADCALPSDYADIDTVSARFKPSKSIKNGERSIYLSKPLPGVY